MSWGADGGRRTMDESFWRHRSEEVREIAETLKTPPAKRDMLVIAAAYARLAKFCVEAGSFGNRRLSQFRRGSRCKVQEGSEIGGGVATEAEACRHRRSARHSISRL